MKLLSNLVDCTFNYTSNLGKDRPNDVFLYTTPPFQALFNAPIIPYQQESKLSSLLNHSLGKMTGFDGPTLHV